MCQFGDSSKIIKELNLEQKDAIRGFRNWYLINPFNSNEKFLKSLNQEFNWPKNELIKANLKEENSLGYYNNNSHYNNNYYNNNSNYNNNYYNNNYYNNNSYYNNNYYNYNNYYYNNYYNYNNYYYNNYYYNICGTSLIHGKIFAYDEGFRSEFAIPEYLIIIDNQKLIKEIPRFTEHFNNSIINIAKEYNCKTINWSDYIKLSKTIV